MHSQGDHMYPPTKGKNKLKVLVYTLHIYSLQVQSYSRHFTVTKSQSYTSMVEAWQCLQWLAYRTTDLQVGSSKYSLCYHIESIFKLDKKFCSKLSLFIQVHIKMGTSDILLGITLWWTSMLSRGELRSNTTRHFMLPTETGLICRCTIRGLCVT